jgi:hypothetical protein
MRAIALTALCLLSASPVSRAFASSFATEVVSYTAGANATPGYLDPNTALGSPRRVNGEPPFESGLTPFNAPYEATDVVSIGTGGSLVVRFDHPVADDASNRFGVDLLVFGNTFYAVDGSGTSAEPGRIAVSQDGVTWFDVAAVHADGELYPTFAYQDATDPFGSDGTVPSSYTRPVNPALGPADFLGKSTAEIAALYAGSGGGAGIDLAPLGLPWIEYVKVYQLAGDGAASDIDAFADVPEPAVGALLGVAALGLTSSRARRSRPSRRAARCARAR